MRGALGKGLDQRTKQTASPNIWLAIWMLIYTNPSCSPFTNLTIRTRLPRRLRILAALESGFSYSTTEYRLRATYDQKCP